MSDRTDAEDNARIGRLFQEAREHRDVTQQEMADPIDLSKNHVSKVERGESKASVSMLLGYCRKLNMSPNEVLGYKDGEIMPELKSFISNLDTKEQEKLLKILKITKSN